MDRLTDERIAEIAGWERGPDCSRWKEEKIELAREVRDLRAALREIACPGEPWEMTGSFARGVARRALPASGAAEDMGHLCPTVGPCEHCHANLKAAAAHPPAEHADRFGIEGSNILLEPPAEPETE